MASYLELITLKETYEAFINELCEDSPFVKKLKAKYETRLKDVEARIKYLRREKDDLQGNN